MSEELQTFLAILAGWFAIATVCALLLAYFTNNRAPVRRRIF